MNLSRIDSSNINKSEIFEANSTGTLFKNSGDKNNEPQYPRSKSRAASSEKINNSVNKLKLVIPEAKKYN